MPGLPGPSHKNRERGYDGPVPDPKSAATPDEYIDALDEPRRADIAALDRLIREILPDLEPHMRSGMIGYGSYHYRYASGREGDWFVVGLASNRRYISLYVVCTVEGRYVAETFKERLPAADIGKSCVRFKRLSDLDPQGLRDLLVAARENPPAGDVAPG